MDKEYTSPRRWSEEETLLALYLYLQLPLGKLHSGNPEIQKLADSIGRTHSSVAMKLCNFASLDPNITESGRKGLQGASKLDRDLYQKFSNDWTRLCNEAEHIWQEKVSGYPRSDGLSDNLEPEYIFEPFRGPSTKETLALQRVGQNFFRRAVIANYSERCCITGISEARLLTASHIIPWREDIKNRHNPANGLLLSGTFDRAFDCGLITIGLDLCVKLSKQLTNHQDEKTRQYFLNYRDRPIERASRFPPSSEFLEWHADNVFLKDEIFSHQPEHRENA